MTHTRTEREIFYSGGHANDRHSVKSAGYYDGAFCKETDRFL
ncbi:hypothetical protein CSUI_011073 [Cystoisospora suis]|uniref:Uncharacterized protein n=1 Tax=Cystoisospora suis TaxID=483139 RepID=A0A2C6KFK8_9APIC|nr:hypothetical protein CSUI_011073 [Cystoisospora suis]